MKTTIMTTCLSVILTALCPAAASTAQETSAAAGAKPLVQIAILLDTSGSMSGLIDQARAELWSIVNQFIRARRNGLEPELRVALYEYGNDSLPAEAGYIRMIMPLTGDLDRISEELFALTTNGGSEYCGWVIQQAASDLRWSDSPDDLKIIFIAGNEPFTQGPVDYRVTCKAAIEKGVIVNTIHCGNETAGIDGEWKNGAVLADGRYLNIDHNRAVVHIDAPQDGLIAELSARLNETYIPYGETGGQSLQRQAGQDKNAEEASVASAVARGVAKSSRNYVNTAWDLVDAVKNNAVKLDDITAEYLPDNMRDMTIEQRKAYVEDQAKKRAGIQQQIQQLNEQREKYVAGEMKKRQPGADTLGSAVIHTVIQQAESRNFRFDR